MNMAGRGALHRAAWSHFAAHLRPHVRSVTPSGMGLAPGWPGRVSGWLERSERGRTTQGSHPWRDAMGFAFGLVKGDDGGSAGAAVPPAGEADMVWWAWLILIVVVALLLLVMVLVVQARRRGGGVIATVRRAGRRERR